MSFFTAQGISAGYGADSIIKDLSFSLEAGSLVGILGANGSGKTTLLKALCGILPHSGRCTLRGEALEALSPRELARRCGYIPQRSGISIDISALDVVLMGFNPRLGLLERPTSAMISAARASLAQVGLAGRESANYLHLSEGQKQLCILARTLVAGSRLLLLDEPESALDFHFRHRMLHTIRQWVAEGDRCGIVALHDPALALNYCDRLLLLSGGTVTQCLCPGEDTLDNMEKKLETIYGPLSLLRCETRSGGEQLVMLKEEPI